MSKQVDEKIVSMQFDNRHFESNVKTTMSTLDRLKEKLNFKGATKGLEDIDSAAKKVDMGTLEKSVESVRVKFSALEVMGVTALANITNSAVNAGKQLVKSLTLDQVTAGMSKYEQKTASVQTIMNATGKSINEVNGYLEKLMWFSDETSYGFTDMTAALGQMTSSGGDIEKLIPLITGVANATAYAGKGAAEFSRVMYNLNQSYGAGYLQLMDWKSLELAGVGSKQLKQTLIDAGVALGTIKEGEVTVSNFAQTLKDKWATTGVMEKAFGKFGEFSDAVHKMVESGEVDTASEAIEKLSGQYDTIAETAFKSAQEAKSFTEAIDATKDAVSSGWMKTFELIFGNYEQAKVLWTDLANTLWDLFASGGESRNAWLEEALSYSPLEKFSEKLNEVTKAIQAPVKKLEEYNDIVNRIIRGDYGDGQSRFDKLAEEGYDWAHAQNLVNEKLGNSFRYATDFSDATSDLTEKTIELTDAKLEEIGLTKEEIKMYRELEAESKKTGKSINELIENMEQADGRTLLIGSFKNVGSALVGVIYSIKEAFSEIFPAPTAMQLYNFIAGLNKLTSCLRLTDAETGELNETGQKLKRTFKGVFAALDIVLTIVGGPIKIAFKALMKVLSAFDLDVLDITASIGDAIVGFRDWIDSTLDFTEVFEYLGSLLKPAAEKIKAWIGSFKSLPIVQEGLNKLKSAFSSDLNSNILVKGLKAVGKVLAALGKGIKQCYDSFMSLPAVQNIISKLGEIFTKVFNSISTSIQGIDLNSVIANITSFFDTISKWLSGLGDQEDNGTNLVSGLGKAISGGVSAVVSAITEICKAIYNTFTNFFDINSPSKVFMTLGKFCIAGLVAGLLFSKKDTASAMGDIGTELLEGVKTAVSTITGFLKEIDLSTIFAVGGVAVMFTTVNKIIDVMDKFGAGVKGFGSMCSEAGSLIKNFNKKLFPQETKMEKTSNVMLKMAAAIGILAASIYVLAKIEPARLWIAVGAVVALSLVLAGLTFAASKLKVNGGDFGKLSVLLLGLSATLLIMATAIKKLEFLNEDNIGPILLGLAGIVGGLVVLLLAFGKLTKGTLAKNINKASMVIAQISLTLLLLTFTMNQMSKLDPTALKKGLGTMVLFGAFVMGFVAVTKLAGKNIKGLGGTLLGISVAMLSFVGLIKLISLLKPEEVAGGIICIALFGGIITGLIAATRLAGGNQIKGIGSTIIALSAAMILLTIAVKILSKIDPAAFTKGIFCITLFGGVITGLIAATRLAGGNSLKGVAGTLLAMSISIGMLAAIAIVLSLISIEGLVKGITAVSILGAIMALMVASTKDSKDAKANIVAMTTAIGIMAASLFVLSLIDTTKLIASTVALSSVMGMFALMTKSLGSMGNSKKWGKSVGSILILTGIVAALGGILILMSKWGNPDALIPAGVAIGIVLGTMVGALNILNNSKKTMSPSALSKNMTALGLMTGIVGALGFLLGALSFIPNPNALIPTATAISILLIAMTGVLAALTAISKIKGNVTSGIISLTAMVVPLAAFGIAISMLPNISDKTTSMIALVGVMTAMTALLMPLTLIGTLGASGAPYLGVLALLTMVVPLVAFSVAISMLPNISDKTASIIALVGVMTAMTLLLVPLSLIGILGLAGTPYLGVLALLAMVVPLSAFALAINVLPDVSGSMPSIMALVTLMTAMTDILVKVSILGPLAIIGVVAINALTKTVILLGGLIAAIGALVTKFPQLETFIDKGIPVLEKVSNGLGSIIGNFISGFATGALSGLPEIGTMLSQFMLNATPFIAGAMLLNGDVMNGVKNLAETIILLTAADFISGITSWITGGASFASFGEDLGTLGEGVKTFADKIGVFDDKTVATVDCASQAIERIATAASKLPNEGGWAGKIFGENGLDKFGEQIASTGTNLSLFATNIGTFGKEQLDTVKYASEAIAAMADAASGIDNQGGWAAAIFGENSLADFGTQMGAVALSLNHFISNIGTFGKDQLDTVKMASEAIVSLADASKQIDKTDGLWQNIIGENGLSSFSDELPGLGTNLYLFAENANKTKIGNIYSVFSLLESLVKLLELGIVQSGASLKQFGIDLKNFGTNLKTFCETVKNVSDKSIDKAVENLKAISDAFAELADKEVDPLLKFAEALNPIGTKGIEGIKQAFTDAQVTIIPPINRFISSASGTIKSQENYDKFVAAGKYLVKGFAKGITDNISIGENAAKDLADAAYKKAKETLDVNSPSKKFMPIGSSVVEGFAKGVTDNLGYATDSAKILGSNMLEATQKELKINSPSIVFSKEVGRWIVKGIADGITKDMSAEEAAEKKAQNIVDAFAKGLSKYDRSTELRETEFNIWSLTDGLTASVAETDAAELAKEKGNLSDALSKQKLYHDEYQETAKYLGEGNEKTEEALNKYKKSIEEVASIQKTISDIEETMAQRDNEDRMKIIDIRETQLNDWLRRNGKTATDAEIDAKYMDMYKANLKTYEEELADANKAHADALKEYQDPDHEKVYEAWLAVDDIKQKIYDTNEAMSNIEKSALDRETQALDDRISLNNKKYELWAKTEGRNLKDEEKEAKYVRTLRENMVDQQKQLVILEQQYKEAVVEYGNESEEVKKAWEDVQDKQLEIANTRNEIADIAEEAEEREIEALKTQHELASDKADLLYQIWEKTEGRKATSVEKNAMRITMLTQQLSNQTGILQIAYDEWKDAASEYGRYSNEAQSAYNDYLNEQLELANLQNEITDIHEATVERQKLAASDYKDYIDKYEQYYLLNGMTKEDLERDAQLVSGYDPKVTVPDIIDKTNSTLEDVTNSPEYSNLLNNFSSLGSSYVSAINEGVQSSNFTLSNTVVTMVGSCIESIKETKQSWIDIGKYIIDGLIEGINHQSYLVVEAVKNIALAALDAAKATMGIESPSKEFAEVGMFAMAGFVQGINDSYNTVTDATSSVGEGAINNLRNTIARISDVVNSDLDTQPTIRPVLDLSNVEAGTARLSSMFSRDQALTISSSMNKRNGNEIQNGVNTPNNGGGNTYQFTQNNYSPKPLSRIEIYRQTKNQFTALKGATT